MYLCSMKHMSRRFSTFLRCSSTSLLGIAFSFAMALLCAGCGHNGTEESANLYGSDSTAIVRRYYNNARKLIELNDDVPSTVLTDSAFHLLLDASDYIAGCHDHALCYSVHYALSRQYEAKNLFALQLQCEERMLHEALRMADAGRIAEAHQQKAVTLLAMDDAVRATSVALQAYATAPKDSLDFRAQTLLVVSQAYIARSLYDSAAHYLQRASEDWPDIRHEALYRISSLYIMGGQGKIDEADALVRKAHSMTNVLGRRSNAEGQQKEDNEVYSAMEEWRFVKSLHKEHGNAAAALAAAEEMLVLADSIANLESAANLSNIHSLQHSSKMQLLEAQHATKAAQMRSGLFFILFVLLAVAIAAYFAIQHQRKKACHAIASELEALRLAEEAHESEQNAWEENRVLQKRYYEHLFAILMPILSAARRTKTGSIDLTEHSWKLIEENTDRVLPEFTTKLRLRHPHLSLDDLRFCCLVAMRVPNAIMADVYAIAPSSVAVRKQRMKKKFDDRLAAQSLEDYLDQYSI